MGCTTEWHNHSAGLHKNSVALRNPLQTSETRTACPFLRDTGLFRLPCVHEQGFCTDTVQRWRTPLFSHRPRLAATTVSAPIAEIANGACVPGCVSKGIRAVEILPTAGAVRELSRFKLVRRSPEGMVTGLRESYGPCHGGQSALRCQQFRDRPPRRHPCGDIECSSGCCFVADWL